MTVTKNTFAAPPEILRRFAPQDKLELNYSVVIPTHNRLAMLLPVLEALGRRRGGVQLLVCLEHLDRSAATRSQAVRQDVSLGGLGRHRARISAGAARPQGAI